MSEKKTKVVPLHISENLDSLAAFAAENEHTDKATALRQWMHKGVELYVVQLVSDGRISATRGAELLGLSIFDVFAIAERYGIELGATDEQRQESRALAASLKLPAKSR